MALVNVVRPRSVYPAPRHRAAHAPCTPHAPTLSTLSRRGGNDRAVLENSFARLIDSIMTRPEDLLYAVDEMPPWPRLLFLGMQHAMLLSVNLVLIVIVFGAPAPAMRPRSAR